MTKFKENQLIKLNGEIGVNSNESSKENIIGGELKLHILENNDKSICIVLNKLGWYSMGFQVGNTHTGKISCLAQAKKSIIQSTKHGLAFSIKTTGEVIYQAIEDKLGLQWLDKDMSIVPPERFEIIVSGKLDVSQDPKPKTKYKLYELKVEMNYLEGGINMIDRMHIYQKQPSVSLLAQSTNFNRLENIGNCHPSLEVNERTLTIQPVGFRSSALDTAPSGSSLNFQMAAAITIWRKCCIEFNVLPIVYITSPTLKTSSNMVTIRASYTSPNANAIEVFFGADNFSAQGGGAANACNSILGNIVMTDNNAGNPQLLSHELGHILGLGHPGVNIGGCVTPDDNTVMAPSGSPNIPNSTNNTHWNCISAANPAISTSTTICCLSHDIPDTIIRDFPEDTGTEPNPGFAGRNFYSMSNVWNRKTSSSGGLNADGTPQHENPARFELDGTTLHPNFLFAKVNALVNLPVRNAEVRFFLKHPGAGGGASNVQLLGTAAIPALSSATSTTVSTSWTIPPGTPSHSCVFAVVHTPAEPAEDLTTLNWNQTEQLIRNDNDWAQRNLSVENILSNIGNLPNRRISFPPIFIDYPNDDNLKPVPIQVEVDLSSNEEAIVELELLFPAFDKSISLKPGRENKVIVDISKSIQPGTKVLMIARAKINAKSIEFEKVLDVFGITPILGEQRIVGYGFQLNKGKTSDAIHQLTDRALSALYDYGEISASPIAAKLWLAFKEIVREACLSIEPIIQLVKENNSRIEAFQDELKRNNRAAYRFSDIDFAFNKLQKSLSNESDDALVFDVIRDLINRLEIFNWFIFSKLSARRVLSDDNC